MFLKPCPFCGGAAKLEYNRVRIGENREMCAYIHCVSCEARSSRVPVSQFGESKKCHEADEAAADLWNNRIKNVEVTYRIIR